MDGGASGPAEREKEKLCLIVFIQPKGNLILIVATVEFSTRKK